MYWDPFEEMERMQKEMNKMFSSYLGRMPTGRHPAMDMMDQGKELVVIMDLPGMKRDDIKIDCTEDHLQVSAESKEKMEGKDEGYYFSERSASSFSRGIPLPIKVIPSKAKSTFNNGVLKIRLPKKEVKEEKKGHRIKVE